MKVSETKVEEEAEAAVEEAEAPAEETEAKEVEEPVKTFTPPEVPVPAFISKLFAPETYIGTMRLLKHNLNHLVWSASSLQKKKTTNVKMHTMLGS